MESAPKAYKAGHGIVLGTVLGAVVGLLVDKFALGMIFGFFVGILVDGARRKRAAGSPPPDAEADTKR